MKKLISLLICVAMIMAFATAAFASADSELAPRPDDTAEKDPTSDVAPRPDDTAEKDPTSDVAPRPDDTAEKDPTSDVAPRPDDTAEKDPTSDVAPRPDDTAEKDPTSDVAPRPDDTADQDRPDPGADQDRPDPGADQDRPDPGADDADRPDPGADQDRPDPGAGEEPPVVEMFTLTVGANSLSVKAELVAMDQQLTAVGDYAFIIYTYAFKQNGGSIGFTNGHGEAFVVNKEGKVVRIFDGANAKYYDEANPSGVQNGTCSATEYAKQALESLKEGETVIIAPHTTVNSADGGSRKFLLSNRTFGATVTGLPEVKDENAGSITVVLTDTYLIPGELHSFTAPVAGKYTIEVPANVGVFSKKAWDNNGRPEIDMYENVKGNRFVVDLKAGEVYEFYASGIAKGTYEFAWTVIPAVEEPETPETPDSNVIKVEITDNNTYVDLATFTATAAGKYTFTLAAGMGAWEKNDCDAWPPVTGPYVDPYDNPAGATFSVELQAGEVLEFYVSNPEKNVVVEIPYTFEASAVSNSDTLVVGENTVTFTEDGAVLEFTFYAEYDGQYKFKNSKLLIQIYDENGNMIPAYRAFLTADTTYTIKLTCQKADTYVLEVVLPEGVVVDKTPELVIGTNNVVFNGEEAIEHTFVVTEAGDYEFKGDALVVIFNADGVRLGAGMVSLEPGTYKANVVDMMGIGGTIKITVVFTPAASAGQTDEEAAAEVDKLIEAIGTVTHDSKEAIEAARNAYEALSDEAKALVKNLKVLEDAEAAFKALPPAAADGSQNNPFTMEVGKTYPIKLEAGKVADTGLFFTFTATEDGTLIITVPGWTDESPILFIGADNKHNGTFVKEVVAGETYTLNPYGKFERAVECELVVSFEKAEAKPGATEDTALDVEEDKSDLTLSFTGAEGTYFAWTATADGTVTFALDSSEWLQGTAITVNGKTLFAYGTRSATFDVKAGDVIYIICKDNSGGDDTIDLDVTFEAAAVEPEQPEQPEDPIDPPVDPEQPDEPVNPDEPIKPMGDVTVYVFAMMAMAATALVVLVSKKRAF